MRCGWDSRFLLPASGDRASWRILFKELSDEPGVRMRPPLDFGRDDALEPGRAVEDIERW